MDIKNVLLLTSDYEYVRHVKGYMTQYHKDLCIRHLASPTEVCCALVSCPACAMIIGMEFDERRFRLPQQLPVAYFADNGEQLERNGRPVFCKYRNGDALYKFITGICVQPPKTPVISAFIGAGGGMGSTTASAAYAKHIAMKNRSVLYICLDRYVEPTALFDGACGTFSKLALSEKAAEGRFAGLPLSETGTDSVTGLSFIGCCTNPSEYRYININTFLESMAALISAKPYDAIVLDGDPADLLYRSFTERFADFVYIVTQNDAASQMKLARMRAETAHESRKPTGVKERISERTYIIVNRSTTDNTAKLREEAVVGCIPEYRGKTAKEIIAEASQLELWQHTSSI